MDDKLSIRINVADRYYPLKIDRSDEEDIRRAAKMINDKVLQYKQKYVDKDIQDFLAMASLQYVIRMLELEKKEESKDLSVTIKELLTDIDKVLKKEE